MKLLTGIYLASIVADAVCAFMLFWTGINALFLVPLLMKFKGQEINAVYNKVKDLVTENLKKVEAIIPRYTEKVKKN